MNIDLSLQKQVGKNIRNYRRARKMNQTILAKRINGSRPYVSNMENAKQNISISTLLELCNALECTPNDLLENCYKVKPKVRKFTKNINDLSPANQKIVSEMINILFNLQDD